MTDHDDYRRALDCAQDLLGQPPELPLGPGEPAGRRPAVTDSAGRRPYEGMNLRPPTIA